MENTKNNELINNEWLVSLYDKVYDKSLEGVANVSKPVKEMADEYLTKNNNNIELAVKDMLKYQYLKVSTTGFATSFGGFATMGITIPAELVNVMYVQMRMVEAMAYMAGYDLHSDQVHTCIYAALLGVSIGSILKQFGVKFGQKVTKSLIDKIPGAALKKITAVMGFRLVAKTGTKSLIVLSKLIPVVGGLVGAGIDYVDTKLIAARAYKLFIEGKDFDDDKVVDIASINPDDIVFDKEELIKDAEVKGETKDEETSSEKTDDDPSLKDKAINLKNKAFDKIKGFKNKVVNKFKDK